MYRSVFFFYKHESNPSGKSHKERHSTTNYQLRQRLYISKYIGTVVSSANHLSAFNPFQLRACIQIKSVRIYRILFYVRMSFAFISILFIGMFFFISSPGKNISLHKVFSKKKRVYFHTFVWNWLMLQFLSMYLYG